MWTRLQTLMPSRLVMRRLLWGCGGVVLVVLAFCWGRWGAWAQAQTAPASHQVALNPLPASTSDYSRRPVAYIHNSIPITREDLGEYLIARFGPERVDFLVNRRIIEHACQSAGISISDAEVEGQLIEDLRQMNIPRLEDFVNNVLKRFNKTLYEYKEDVIRPKLALAKFCQQHVKVLPEDLQRAFEAKYGPKVECRMIVLSKEQGRHKMDIWSKVSKSEEEFNRAAREQSIPALAAKGGEMPPIHKHFGDPRIEQEAFSLKPGEVSKLIDMADGTSVILKCVKHIPADNTRRFEEERLHLQKEVYDIKLAQEIPKVFQQLRARADPKIFLKREGTPVEIERRINQMLQAGNRVPPPPPGAAQPHPQPQASNIPVPPVPQAVTAPKGQ